jgi:hypothetical protein
MKKTEKKNVFCNLKNIFYLLLFFGLSLGSPLALHFKDDL